jgi:antitoxin component YwqK of YwqJK toxin-antitoxin module
MKNMKKVVFIFFGLLFIWRVSKGQSTQEYIIYIVDSIPVIDDPGQEQNSLGPAEIGRMVVVTNKDTLKMLGFPHMDKAIFVFTKEYEGRSDSAKRIPRIKQMSRKNGKWFFEGSPTPYSGPFIDYYFNGKKQDEGKLNDGKLTGLHTMYYYNGHLSFQRHYVDGIADGEEREYYQDGSLSQKGDFKTGAEEGIWEMYYPNGQVKQHNVFENAKMVGESVSYYSSGKLKATELIKNGKALPDPAINKIQKLYDKGVAAEKDGDHGLAIKDYSKCLDIDNTYAEAYFGRGTVKLNTGQYESAIADLDIALQFEPYFKEALANRAFCRIQKHESSRVITGNKEITVMAIKDKEPIPQAETVKICTDLKRATFLDPKSSMLKSALSTYCPLQ